MSCGCPQAPMCGCSISMTDDVNPNYQVCTVCDGDTSDPCNIWYVNGVCKLDQLTYSQVLTVLERVPRARADLMKITTDPTLLTLAREAKLVSDEIESDKAASDLINKGRGGGAGTLPFYTLLRGNSDGSFGG